MPLPVISRQTMEDVESRWMNGGEEANTFILETITELEGKNPELMKVFERMFQKYKNSELFYFMSLYGLSVYRMLALHGEVPILSETVGGPIVTEFMRDPLGYCLSNVDQISQRNPMVNSIAINILLGAPIPLSDQQRQLVAMMGILIYKLIEAQQDANDLADSLGWTPS